MILIFWWLCKTPLVTYPDVLLNLHLRWNIQYMKQHLWQILFWIHSDEISELATLDVHLDVGGKCQDLDNNGSKRRGRRKEMCSSNKRVDGIWRIKKGFANMTGSKKINKTQEIKRMRWGIRNSEKVKIVRRLKLKHPPVPIRKPIRFFLVGHNAPESVCKLQGFVTKKSIQK